MNRQAQRNTEFLITDTHRIEFLFRKLRYIHYIYIQAERNTGSIISQQFEYIFKTIYAHHMTRQVDRNTGAKFTTTHRIDTSSRKPTET